MVGIPKVVFKLLIDFLYTDTMDPRIDPELAHDVMCGAAVYSLPRLARLAEVSPPIEIWGYILHGASEHKFVLVL